MKLWMWKMKVWVYVPLPTLGRLTTTMLLKKRVGAKAHLFVRTAVKGREEDLYVLIDDTHWVDLMGHMQVSVEAQSVE